MGVKATRVVKYIRKGETGDKGEQGAVLRGPQAWSDCATGYAFQAGGPNEKWIDVVLYNNNYYVCKQSHTKTSSNYPGSSAGNSLWQLGDKIALVATNILLASYALVKNLGVEAIDMKDANGNVLFQAKDGNVVCKTGTFENVTVKGTLEGVSGSFKSLDCVNNSGTRIGGISFNSSGQMTFEGDLYSQGYDYSKGRGYRFYSSDIWCRGIFGARERSVFQCYGGFGYWWPKGLGGTSIYVALQTGSTTSGGTYYKVPCYGTDGDYAGMPVDIIAFCSRNTTASKYELQLAESQRVLCVNCNDDANNVIIMSNGYERTLNGGSVFEAFNLTSLLYPSVPTERVGRGTLIGAMNDNDW